MRKQFLFTCPLGPMASHSVIWNSWLMEGIVPWGLLHCCRSHLLCAPWDPWELKAWQGQLPGRTDSFSWEAAAMSKCLAGLMKRYSLPRVPRGRLWIKKETKNWVSCCLVLARISWDANFKICCTQKEAISLKWCGGEYKVVSSLDLQLLFFSLPYYDAHESPHSEKYCIFSSLPVGCYSGIRTAFHALLRWYRSYNKQCVFCILSWKKLLL